MDLNSTADVLAKEAKLGTDKRKSQAFPPQTHMSLGETDLADVLVLNLETPSCYLAFWPVVL